MKTDTEIGNPHTEMLRGAREIARYIKESERRTNYLLETNSLPAFKIGRQWHMRPATYDAMIENFEAEAIATVTKSRERVSL
jgi:hypothetical protein